MNCGGDRGTIRVEIWHRLKDPVQTDRMGAPPLRPQGAEPAAGRRARRRAQSPPQAGGPAEPGRAGPHPAGCREWNRKEKRRWVRS